MRTGFVALLAFSGGLGAHLLFGSAEDAQASPQAESPYAAMGQLGRVLVEVENDYVDPVDRARLVNGAIKGMVDELDPHSSYMPPQDYQVFQSDTEGEFGGIGVEVDARNDTVTVLAPIEGSPAARAGIKPGDRIVAVDGQTIQGIGLDKLVRKMRGAPGTHVKISIRRDHVDDLLTFDLERAIVHVASVDAQRLDGNVAYIRVKQFQDKTHDELLAAIGKLRAQGPIAGVVLDMRNNPGGLVDEAAGVADEFLSGGNIYSLRHRGQVVEEASAHGGGALVDVPVVVLVNQWSASAAELVTGALQDQHRATVVGVRTFGKGSVQSILDLPGGAGLRLTTARYYTPSGHAIQADGVHPDVIVKPSKPGDLPPLRERDLQGALPAETQGGGPDAGVVITYDTDGGAPDDLESHKVPADPTKGSDPVLKVGYQLLRNQMTAHAALAR